MSSNVLIEQVSRMEAHLPDTSGLHLGSKPLSGWEVQVAERRCADKAPSLVQNL